MSICWLRRNSWGGGRVGPERQRSAMSPACSRLGKILSRKDEGYRNERNNAAFLLNPSLTEELSTCFFCSAPSCFDSVYV